MAFMAGMAWYERRNRPKRRSEAPDVTEMKDYVDWHLGDEVFAIDCAAAADDPERMVIEEMLRRESEQGNAAAGRGKKRKKRRR